MRIKVKNQTSDIFDLSFTLEHESIQTPIIKFVQLTNLIQGYEKATIGHLSFSKKSSVSNTNCLVWISLALRGCSEEIINLKIRHLTKQLGSDILFSLSTSPFLALYPEQQWYSSDSVSLIGIFRLLFLLKLLLSTNRLSRHGTFTTGLLRCIFLKKVMDFAQCFLNCNPGFIHCGLFGITSWQMRLKSSSVLNEVAILQCLAVLLTKRNAFQVRV